MDFTALIEARKLLGSLWEKALLKGRCWGLRKKEEDNPYLGSNITIAMAKELVTISEADNGELKIHEFVKTTNTNLGKEVRKILRKGKLKRR